MYVHYSNVKQYICVRRRTSICVRCIKKCGNFLGFSAQTGTLQLFTLDALVFQCAALTEMEVIYVYMLCVPSSKK